MKTLYLSALILLSFPFGARADDKIEPIKTLSGHPGGIYSLAFSSDSGVLVSAGENGTINLWDMRDFHSMRTWKDHSGSVYGIFYDPSEKLLISGSADQTVLIRSATDYTILQRIAFSSPVTGLSQSPNGKFMAALLDDREIHFFETRGLKMVKTFDAKTPAAFSANNRTAALADMNLRIALLDLEDWNVTPLPNFKGQVGVLTFNPQGSMLASAHDDFFVRVWDPRTLKLIKKIPVSGSDPMALAFSRDGRFLAYGGVLMKEGTAYRHNDSEFYVWDFIRGKRVAALSGHRGAILSLAFSPDGKWLVSGSADKTAKVWDVKSFSPKAKKEAPKAIKRKA